MKNDSLDYPLGDAQKVIRMKRTGNDMFRAYFIQYSTDKSAFYFRVHHTIFDGYSIRLFFEQLEKAYFAYKNGGLTNVSSPFYIWEIT